LAEKLLTKAEWLKKKFDRAVDRHTYIALKLGSIRQEEQAARKVCEEIELELNQELEKQQNR